MRAWDKLPEETGKAYDAFLNFINQDPATRTKVAVGRTLGKHPSQIDEWASKYNWNARADAYDMYMQTQLVEMKTASLAETREAATQALLREVANVSSVLDELLRQLQQRIINKEPVALKEMREFTAAWRITDDLRRRAIGLPTTYTSNPGAEVDEDNTYLISLEGAKQLGTGHDTP